MAYPWRTFLSIKRAFLFAMLFVLVLLASGCPGDRSGDKVNENSGEGKSTDAEAASLDLIADLNKAADILSTIEDKKSAQTAEPQLKAAVRHLRKTMERIKTIAPSPAEESRLRTKYLDSLHKASRRLVHESERIASNEETREALHGSLAEFKKLLKQQEKKR